MLHVVQSVSQCAEAERCINSVSRAGDLEKCSLCRLAPGNEELGSHYWKPLYTSTRELRKHPVLEKQKVTNRIARTRANALKRVSRDKDKVRISRKAVKAEKATESNIIKATKNSGRSNRDGDHVVAGMITLDTKLQTTLVNPVVDLGQLMKVRRDALNGGNRIGGLMLRNKNGLGVVVMLEQDFARIAARLAE